MLGGSLAELVNWLLVTLGGALFAGTAAALAHYRRTGVFPGQPLDEAGEPGRPAVRTAVVKCVAGLLLAAWGVAGLTLVR